jgi:hypothetical protein
MSKIAAKDNAALNRLYKDELIRMGSKTAADSDPDAFKDHEDYEKELQEVLDEDTKESWDPNDPLLD